MMRCAVTGASGYIGQQIVNTLRAQDYFVYELGRSKQRVQSTENFLQYALDQTELPNLNGVNLLIHCAYDFTADTMKKSQHINLAGSLRLFQHAKASGVKKIIVISSMSAFKGAKSIYGKTKFALEKQATGLGAIVIRPGLVFGEKTQGIVGAMKKFVAKSAVVPLISNGQQKFHPCYIADLCQLILHLIESDKPTDKPIIAATKQPVTFREIVKALAETNRKKVFMVPIPFTCIWLGLKTLEALRINIGLRSDSLIGAQYHDKNPDFSGAGDVQFRPLDATLL